MHLGPGLCSGLKDRKKEKKWKKRKGIEQGGKKGEGLVRLATVDFFHR